MPFYSLLTRKFATPFTYESKTDLKVGSIANINFNNHQTTGLIIGETPRPDHDTKPIDDLLLESGLTQTHVDLCKWMAEYYHCGLDKCIKLFLPDVIWRNKQPKREQTIHLIVPLEEALEQTKRSKLQMELVQKLSHSPLSCQGEGVRGRGLRGLLKKSLITITEGQILSPLNPTHYPLNAAPQHHLTTDQEEILNRIKTSENHRFLLHGITGSGKTEIYLRLIQQILKKTPSCQGGGASLREAGEVIIPQALLLVPEIALTTQLIQYFFHHFPNKISVIHSNLSDSERLQEWHRIRSGESQLILGSRSALFTPWTNLQLIILDEEHEWTYKQDSTPRYHTREVAEKFLSLPPKNPKAPNTPNPPTPLLLLGSATPSLETFYQSQITNHQSLNTTYQLLTLKDRATKEPLPPVKVLDLRHEFEKRNFTCIAEELQEAIKIRLNKKEQVVLFLNKRGHASSLLCRTCGYAPTCDNCAVKMTLHKISATNYQLPATYLICHYCGSATHPPTTCPSCSSAQIKEVGTGTAKAAEQLKQLFPQARILRADKDTTGTKKGFENIYNAMKEEKADILIGTQMITKGLDLPKVTLVGVLLADIGLHIPDFRASERVFQLLTQVAGRSGRHAPGEVFVQTYQPDHPAIRFASRHDYVGFYNHEIQIRKTHNYPPFTEIIRLTYKHPNRETAKGEAIKLYRMLKASSPAPQGVASEAFRSERAEVRGEEAKDERRKNLGKESGDDKFSSLSSEHPIERDESHNLPGPAAAGPHPERANICGANSEPRDQRDHNPASRETTHSLSLTPHLFPRLHGKYIWHIYIKGKNPIDMLKNIQLPKGWIADRNPNT